MGGPSSVLEIPPGGSIGADGEIFDANGNCVKPRQGGPTQQEMDRGYEEIPELLCPCYCNVDDPRWCVCALVGMKYACVPNVTRICVDVRARCCGKKAEGSSHVVAVQAAAVPAAEACGHVATVQGVPAEAAAPASRV